MCDAQNCDTRLTPLQETSAKSKRSFEKREPRRCGNGNSHSSGHTEAASEPDADPASVEATPELGGIGSEHEHEVRLRRYDLVAGRSEQFAQPFATETHLTSNHGAVSSIVKRSDGRRLRHAANREWRTNRA